MELLDLRIRLQLQVQKIGQSQDQVRQFKGLLISEEEVEGLLNHRTHNAGNSMVNDLREAISRMELYLCSRIDKSLEDEVFLPLEYLSSVFGLNHFEKKCVLLCLAVECERKYEKLYGFLQDDITCKYPSIDLALKLLCETHEEKTVARLSFIPDSSMMKYLMQEDRENSRQGARLSYPLKLDRRILDFFFQPRTIDTAVQSFAQFYNPYVPLAPLLLDEDIQERLRVWWETVTSEQNTRKPMLILTGPAGSGKRFQVQHLCHHFKYSLFVIDLSQMMLNEVTFAQNMQNVIRECLLTDAVPCFARFDSLYLNKFENNINIELQPSRECWSVFLQCLEELPGPVIILSANSLEQAELNRIFAVLKQELGIPNELTRKKLWEVFSQSYIFFGDTDWGQMASKFRFTPGQIKNALLHGCESSYGRQEVQGRISLEELHSACFRQGRNYLGKTAAKIKPVYDWQDLVVPAETMELLMNGCNQMKYRHVVYGQWGFEKRLAYGRGLSMLFSGLPGTGKTMAAQVIANELKLELYRIDLAQVVSKYIGETEKNLRQIFSEAESSNAILFFDEADALFGKRSEVKDSHDRYANIEIAYLLQKVEEYDGISILATNLMKNMDEAFLRRITFIVEFPFPDKEYRKKIWLSMFPKKAPLHEEVDFDFLASRFEIAGGNIKNIVLASAFLAAQTKEQVGMQHILRALKYEYQKIGRVILKEDLGEYYNDLMN